MGNWLNTLDPVNDNLPDLWNQFLVEFEEQFQDTQAEQQARNALKECKMVNNEYDAYVAKFEALARKARYTQGNPETFDMFLVGLPQNILVDVLKPPAP
jgi:hypothetical protein